MKVLALVVGLIFGSAFVGLLRYGNRLEEELSWQRAVSESLSERVTHVEEERDGWRRSFETTSQALFECSEAGE